MSQDATVRIGVIGLGRVSGSHLAGYESCPSARIVAVCDLDAERAATVAAAVGARPHTSYERLLEEDDVDAVAILLPHRLHFPVARAALEAGKHVCLEKPFTVTEAEADALIELGRERDLTVALAENTRFVTAYLELQKLLAQGALGEIRSIRAYIAGSAIEEYLDDTARWKREAYGAGTIMDTSPHMLYLLKWLFGDIKNIRTITRNWFKGIEVDDHAIELGELESGAMFSLEFCLVAEYPWSERVEVHGSTGSLVIDQLLDPPAVIYRGDTDLEGTPVDAVPYDMDGWKARSIERAIHDFVEAVLERREPGVQLSDVKYVQRLIDCAYRSAEADGALVEVGPAPALSIG